MENTTLRSHASITTDPSKLERNNGTSHRLVEIQLTGALVFLGGYLLFRCKSLVRKIFCAQFFHLFNWKPIQLVL